MATSVAVFKFSSQRVPGRKHVTKVRKVGKALRITCTCMGFTVHGHCKHQQMARDKFSN